jgi:hypothetical protein
MNVTEETAAKPNNPTLFLIFLLPFSFSLFIHESPQLPSTGNEPPEPGISEGGITDEECYESGYDDGILFAKTGIQTNYTMNTGDSLRKSGILPPLATDKGLCSEAFGDTDLSLFASYRQGFSEGTAAEMEWQEKKEKENN